MGSQISQRRSHVISFYQYLLELQHVGSAGGSSEICLDPDNNELQ